METEYKFSPKSKKEKKMQAKQQQLRLVKTIRTAMGNLTTGRFPALTTLHKYIAVIVYFFEREHDLLPATGVMVPPRGALLSFARYCYQRFSDIYWQWNDGPIAELKTKESVIIRDEMVEYSQRRGGVKGIGCRRNNLIASAGKILSDDIQLLICEYLDTGFLVHPIERVVQRVVDTPRVIRCFANLEEEAQMEIARIKMDHLLEPALLCLETKALSDILTKSRFYGIIAKQFSPNLKVRDPTDGRLPSKYIDKRRVIMEAIIGAMNFCPTVRPIGKNGFIVAIELGPSAQGGRDDIVVHTGEAVSRDMVRQKLGNIAIYLIDYILELASRKVHAVELPLIAKRDAKLRKQEKKKRGKRPAEDEEEDAAGAGGGGAGGGGEPVKRRRAPATGTVPGRRRRRVLVDVVEEVAEGDGAGGGGGGVAAVAVSVVVDLTDDNDA